MDSLLSWGISWLFFRSHALQNFRIVDRKLVVSAFVFVLSTRCRVLPFTVAPRNLANSFKHRMSHGVA